MGLLDDAIREHLELKRRRGADPTEVARQEHEALGPAAAGSAAPSGRAGRRRRRATSPLDAPATTTPPDALEPAPPEPSRRGRRAAADGVPPPEPERRGARAEPEPVPPPEPEPASAAERDEPTSRPRRRRAERRRRARDAATAERGRAATPSPADEDVLEETPGVPAGDAGARPALVRAEARRATSTSTTERRRPPLTWLDVFTATPLTGQRARRRPRRRRRSTTRRCSRFARETHLSETTFVQTATRDGRRLPQPHLDDARRAAVRRPSVARHGRRRRAARAASAQATLRPADARRAAADRRRSSTATARARVDAPGAGRPSAPSSTRREVLGAPSASTPSDADPELPPQVVSTGRAAGHRRRSRDAEALAARRARLRSASSALLDEHEAIVLYLAAVDAGRRPRARAQLRPPPSMGEDPATGSAAGPAAWPTLHARAGAERLDIDQGVEMGRPSLLRGAVEGDRVRVGGDVVVLVEGTVRCRRRTARPVRGAKSSAERPPAPNCPGERHRRRSREPELASEGKDAVGAPLSRGAPALTDRPSDVAAGRAPPRRTRSMPSSKAATRSGTSSSLARAPRPRGRRGA